jgi:hypothetical protein
MQWRTHAQNTRSANLGGHDFPITQTWSYGVYRPAVLWTANLEFGSHFKRTVLNGDYIERVLLGTCNWKTVQVASI